MITSTNDATTAGDGGAARERRCDAYILSSDDVLLLELGPAIGDRFRTRPVERIEELPTADAAPWVGFIDGTRPDARSVALHIEKQLPNAALIVVTDQSDVASWQGLVFRGTVCAALGSTQIGTAALQDALARAQERLRRAATQSAIRTEARPPIAPSSGSGGLGASPGARPAWLWPAVGAAALVIVLAGWRWLQGDRPAAPGARAAKPAAAAPAALPQRSSLELLSAARSAFRDPDRQLPRADGRGRGESALELYAQVLAQEPANAEARDGVRRLYSVGRSRLQSDLAANRMDDAQRLLAIFRGAASDPATLKAMEADVAAAQPRWLQSQVRRALSANDLAAAEQAYAQLQATGAERATLQELRRALDARAADAQLQALADELHAAIAAGNLLEPAAGNARARLQSMRQANRTHPLTSTAQHDLQEALLVRAREAQSAGQPEAVQRWLNAAAELGPSSELSDFRRQLQAEADKPAARAATPAPQAPPPPAAPASAAPPAAAAAAAPVAPAANAPRFLTARPVQPLTVAYPETAARIGRQGFVVVEFTLGRDGRASEATVIESSPVGLFDRAALDAVARGRFDTSALADPTAPHRSRLRVSFKPN